MANRMCFAALLRRPRHDGMPPQHVLAFRQLHHLAVHCSFSKGGAPVAGLPTRTRTTPASLFGLLLPLHDDQSPPHRV